MESLKLKRERQEWLQRGIKDLSQDLKERNESDEWLQAEIDQYEQRVAVHEEHKQQQMKQYENLRQIIKQAQEKLRLKNVEAGKHEQQEFNHQQQIQKRKAIINESSRRHNIRGYEAALDDMQVEEYIEKLSRLSKEQAAAVESVRRETDREMRRVQEILSKLGERRSALHEGKNTSKQQITTNDRKIGVCSSDLRNINIDDGSKAIIDANLEDLEDRFKISATDFITDLWDKKIHDSNAELRTLEEESEQLNRDLVEGTSQAGDLAHLDHLKKEAAARQRNLATLKGVYNEKLRALLDHEWQPSSLEADFEGVYNRTELQAKEAERQRDAISRSLEQIDFQLSSTQRDLKNCEKERDTCEKRLRKNVEGEPGSYPAALSEIQRSRDVLKSDEDNFENTRKFYVQAIKLAKQHGKCKLCTRSFDSDKAGDDFVVHMEQKIDKAALLEIQKDLKEYEDDLRKAKEVGPIYDAWVRLSRTELPKLGTAADELKLKRKALLQDIEGHDKTVSDLQQAFAEVETLSKPIANVVKYHNEIVDLSRRIQGLVAKQKDAGMSRTLENIQEQLRSVGARLRDRRNTITELTAEKDRARVRISTLELDLSKARNNLENANHQLDKRGDIEGQIEELRKANQEQRDTIRGSENQIIALGQQIAEEEAKLEDIRQCGNNGETGLQQDASKLSEAVHRLNLATQTIQAYVDEGGPAKLSRCQREIESAQQEIRQTEEEQQHLTLSINKIVKDLQNQQETKRIIVDNIKYRRSVRELEECEEKIKKLMAQNAEADQEHWDKQASRWHKKYDEFSTQKTSKFGAARAKDDQVAKLVADWKTDYQDAAKNYKMAHIQVEASIARPKLQNTTLINIRPQKLQ